MKSFVQEFSVLDSNFQINSQLFDDLLILKLLTLNFQFLYFQILEKP